MLLAFVALVLLAAPAFATGSGPPINTTLPTLSGTAKEGQKLKVNEGNWSGAAKIKYAYEWQRCNSSGSSCTGIPKAAKSSYRLTGEDVGHTITAVVTARNAAGSQSATTTPTAVVAGTAPTPRAAPAISGTTKAGQMLSSNTGTWSGTKPISYSYQWQACNSSGASCTNIPEATEATFALTGTQLGGTVRSVITAKSAAGERSSDSRVSQIITASAPVPRINLCGTLATSETLSPEAAEVYVLTCSVTVATGAKLAAEPGTVVKAAPNTTLTVSGQLDLNGTSAAPVIFTSTQDESVGGDTTQPDEAGPKDGDWGGIVANGTVSVGHSALRYAGISVDWQTSDGNDVTITNSDVRGGPISCRCGGRTDLADDTVEQAGETAGGDTAGINVIQAGGAQLTVREDRVTEMGGGRQGGLGESSGGVGIFIDAEQTVEDHPPPPIVEDNFVAEATNEAMILHLPEADPALLAGNTGRGNGLEIMGFDGTMTKSLTLPFAGLPIEPYRGTFAMIAGTTLRVEPGTVVKSLAARMQIEGSLVADGTAQQPIVFTSIRDQKVGGELDKVETNPVPSTGEWRGLSVRESVSVEHASIRYGGLSAGGGGDCAAATVTYSEFFYSFVDANCAGAITIEHDAVRDAGEASESGAAIEALEGEGQLDISNNAVAEDGGGPVNRPEWSPVFFRRGVGIYAVVGWSEQQLRTPPPIVSNNTISGAGGEAILMHAPRIDPTLITGNTGTGNRLNVLGLDGTLIGNLTLPMPGLAIEPYEDFFDGSGSLTVAERVTLTVEPGATIKSYHEPLVIDGSLVAEGTASQPITFTSVEDNSVGESADPGIGTDAEASSGDWPGIQVTGGEASLSHATIAYASIGLRVTQGLASMRGSVRDDSFGIEACEWTINLQCSVDAAYTYWGSSGGPDQPGKQLACGEVLTTPWLTSPSGTSTESADPFLPGSCSGARQLDAEFAAEQAAGNTVIDGVEIECDNGYQEACETIKTIVTCFNATVSAVQPSTPFDVTPQNVLSTGGDFLSTFSDPAVSSFGEAIGEASTVFDVATAIVDLGNAYSQCP